ncbi:MAG: hypothetical protein V3573_12530 [Desulfovibrionaceae bacterium]
MTDPKVDGVYQIAYKGAYGTRTATVRLRENVISGMDTGGGVWKGSYTCGADKVRVEMAVSQPGLDGTPSVFHKDSTQGLQTVTFDLPPSLDEIKRLDILTNHGPLEIYLERLED